MKEEKAMCPPRTKAKVGVMRLQSREADGHQILDAAGNIFRQSVQKHHNSVTTFSPMILNFGGMASSTTREYLSIALKHQDYGNMLQKL